MLGLLEEEVGVTVMKSQSSRLGGSGLSAAAVSAAALSRADLFPAVL